MPLPPIDLDLTRPRVVTPGPVDLNLGDDAPTGSPARVLAVLPAPDALIAAIDLTGLDAAVVAQLPAPVAVLASQIGVATAGAITAALPAPAAVLSASYDLAVPRGPALATASGWQTGTRSARQAVAPWQRPQPSRLRAAAAWDAATPTAAKRRCPFAALSTAARPQAAIAWGAGTRRGRMAASHWRTLDTSQRPERRIAWAQASPAGTSATLPWITLYRNRRPQVVGPWADGTAAGIVRAAPHQVARPARIGAVLPWGEGTARTGWGTFVRFPDPPQPPEPPCYTHPIGVVDLDLTAAIQVTPGPVLLALACPKTYPPGTIVIPAQRSYIVVTTASLARLADGANIPCSALSLSIDADSWGWQFRATCPADALALLDGGALRARVQGVDWHVVVDAIARSRQFPSAEVTLTGRGLAAELAAPFSTVATWVNTAPRNAQQLAAEALPFEWTLDWQAPDWLVPAGAYSHRGTPIDAVLAVAGAIRAVVQAQRTGRTLAVLPRWPVAPWSLPTATPDVVLPLAPVLTLSESYSEAADLNAVYVSGTAQGIVARVWRSGTAGDLLAPQVSDPLITETLAARTRGIAELADGGAQAEVQIELPLDPGTSLPLLQVGQIVQVGETPAWRGLVRGVAVTADRPSARQRITLDRRY